MTVQLPENLPAKDEIAARGADLWQKVVSLQIPSQADYVNYLTAMHLAVALIIFACGLVYLLHGWKIFKTLVVVNSALLGALAGSHLGGMLQGQNTPIFAGIAGALLCAVLSWPLMQLAVGLMAGIAGGILGGSLWSYVTEAVGQVQLARHSWAGALIGLVTLGLLAFVVLRVVVMVFTSLQGSLMTVSGIIAILMQVGPLRAKLHSGLMTNSHLMALLLGTPAVIGFGFQYAAMAKKAKKKKKASEEG